MSNSRYVGFKKIGQGGQGIVYQAYDMYTQHKVCIKRIKQPALFERNGIFLRQQLSYPAFVKTIETYEDDKYFYHVMEYVEGESLQVLLRQIPPKKAIAIGLQLLEALDDLSRQQLTYNDFKPDNILLDQWGNIHIIDVGAILKVGDIVSRRYGSIYFSAPEFLAKKEVSWQSDLYSVAKIVEYITDKPSFIMSHWISKATAIIPHYRFSHLHEAYFSLSFSLKKWIVLLMVMILSWAIPVYPTDVYQLAILFPSTMDVSRIDDPYLFHSLNLYKRIPDKKKLELSNHFSNLPEPFFFVIQTQLCCDCSVKKLNDRYLYMKKHTLNQLNLDEDNISFYLKVFNANKDKFDLEEHYNYLAKQKHSSILASQWQIELAFYLKDDDKLKDCLKQMQDEDALKALCLLRLFQNGDYQKEYLYQALQLVKDGSQLYTQITKTLDQWGG